MEVIFTVQCCDRDEFSASLALHKSSCSFKRLLHSPETPFKGRGSNSIQRQVLNKEHV